MDETKSKPNIYLRIKSVLLAIVSILFVLWLNIRITSTRFYPTQTHGDILFYQLNVACFSLD